MAVVPITSPDLGAAEVSFFAALCSDDFRYLGVPDGELRSSWAHCSQIVRRAETHGFRNILCPSSYQVGQDTLSFVAGCAPITERMNLLAAVRCGEMQPIMLARTVATLDHMLEGRLTINIISSDFPGQTEDSAFRYQRSREVVEILKQAWTRDEITYHGDIYDFDGVQSDPARPYQQNGGPLLYFGGYSPAAVELCAQHCDVYLMWPETREDLAARMKTVNERAEAHGRTLDYGLRVHMIVRDTEAEAREYAQELVSRLDDDAGREIRERRWTAHRLASPARPATASLQIWKALSNRICGRVSGVPGRAAGRRLSGRPTRFCRKSNPIRRWACEASSFPAIRISRNAIISASWCFPN